MSYYPNLKKVLWLFSLLVWKDSDWYKTSKYRFKTSTWILFFPQTVQLLIKQSTEHKTTSNRFYRTTFVCPQKTVSVYVGSFAFLSHRLCDFASVLGPQYKKPTHPPWGTSHAGVSSLFWVQICIFKFSTVKCYNTKNNTNMNSLFRF